MIEFKQIILEASYDSISRTISKDIFDLIKKDNSNTVRFNQTYFIGRDMEVDIHAAVNRLTTKSARIKLPYDISCTFNPDEDNYTDNIIIKIQIIKEFEKKIYSELFYELQESIRHEIEHSIRIGNNERENKINPDNIIFDDSIIKNITAKDYFLSKKEIPAFVSGFHLAAKRKRKPIVELMDVYLSSYVDAGVITKQESEYIINKWMDFHGKVYKK